MYPSVLRRKRKGLVSILPCLENPSTQNTISPLQQYNIVCFLKTTDIFETICFKEIAGFRKTDRCKVARCFRENSGLKEADQIYEFLKV